MGPNVRRARGEDGVSILLALGFLAMFAALVPIILNLGTTNLLDTQKFANQRSVVYAADGATDAAIQFLRLNRGCGIPFQKSTGTNKCPTFTGLGTSTFKATLNGQPEATTTITAKGDAFDVDRTVQLDTKVGETLRVTARVVLHDSQVHGSVIEAPVDVQSWLYKR